MANMAIAAFDNLWHKDVDLNLRSVNKLKNNRNTLILSQFGLKIAQFYI